MANFKALDLIKSLNVFPSPFIAVTTMHKAGYDKYGERMLKTFDENWPKNVRLHAYLEDFEIDPRRFSRRIIIHDLHKTNPLLTAFKIRNKSREQSQIEKLKASGMHESEFFKWQAIRFSNKVFSIYHRYMAELHSRHSHLIWLDADVHTFAKIPRNFLNEFVKTDYDISYLGRTHMHSECGFMIYNLKSTSTKEFLDDFVTHYTNDDVYHEQEYHDSFIFDLIRQKHSSRSSHHINISKLNTDVSGSNHPFINSSLGNYMDHVKGFIRKDQGHSRTSDLDAQRKETYWASLNPRQNSVALNKVSQYKSIARELFSLLKTFSFPLSILGQGKDGRVYKCLTLRGVETIKILTPYALIFQKRMAAICNLSNGIEQFFPVIHRGNKISYPFIHSREVRIDGLRDISKILSFIAEIEMNLIPNGFILWDFGNSHMNYLAQSSGELKWIDYGGNGFLPLSSDWPLPIDFKRQNLVIATDSFLKFQLFIHLAHFALGNRSFDKLSSQIQFNCDAYPILSKKLEEAFSKTNLNHFYHAVQDLDLLTVKGWEHVKVLANGFSDLPIEKEDLDEIEIQDNFVKVRGYQNFDLTSTSVLAKDLGHSWANSSSKFQIVSKALKENSQTFRSFLDIGCNLGMYVFYAGIELKKESFGCDYNEKYIEACDQANSAVQGNCSFFKTRFSEIQTKYDFVTALGIIHHLYSKSEASLSLGHIVERFAQITNKFAIIEFPTEHDKKALKWVRYNGGDLTQYSKSTFESCCKKHFESLSIIGYADESRPIYLLTK